MAGTPKRKVKAKAPGLGEVVAAIDRLTNTIAAAIVTRSFGARTVGDLPPPTPGPPPVPVPPPPPCDLSAICGQIQAFFATLASAPSGSLLQTEDGGILLISPPNSADADLIVKFDHTTRFWTTASAP